MNLCRYSKYIALVLVLSLVSCSDEETIASVTLEGTLWTETNFALSGCDDTGDNGSTETICTDISCTTIQFKDGIVEAVIVTGSVIETETGTYTINGNTMIINFMGLPVVVTFTVIGNEFTMTLEDPVNKGCTRTVIYSGS